MIAQPIIRTRPITSYIDFCWFVQPLMLAGLPDVLGEMKSRIDDVLNTDVCSGGQMKSERWHVLKIGRFTLIGWVTTGFDFKDEKGRAVRGYYGFVFDGPAEGVPFEEEFKKLHEKFVAPYLYASSIDIKNGENFEVSIQPCDVNPVAPQQFNHSKEKVRFFGRDRYTALELLRCAVNASRDVSEFEFVYGLNSNYYAIKKRFMNVVSHEQLDDVIEDLPSINQNRVCGRQGDHDHATRSERNTERNAQREDWNSPFDGRKKRMALCIELIDGRNSWFLESLYLACRCYEWVRGKKATCRMCREYGHNPSRKSATETEWRPPRARY